jgi:hypothetical protein
LQPGGILASAPLLELIIVCLPSRQREPHRQAGIEHCMYISLPLLGGTADIAGPATGFVLDAVDQKRSRPFEEMLARPTYELTKV